MQNIIIIGSGPAGYTAAIYASRAMLEPVLITGIQPGGQLTITTEIENFPGFPEPLGGIELMELMKQQAERFGTTIIDSNVKSVDFSGVPLKLELDNGESYESKSVIIATGASARYLGLESEDKLKGRGVSACATCDGFFFRGKEVVVIGGGDSAIEEATFLTRFASKVTIIHRRDELRASKIMQQKAFDNDKIEFAWDSLVDEILGVEQGEVTGIRLRNAKSDELTTLECQGVFLGIGHTPNTSFLGDAIELDDAGFVTLHANTQTDVKGVFAAGDVADTRYRQAITAAGMGCQAALDAEKYLGEG